MLPYVRVPSRRALTQGLGRNPGPAIRRTQPGLHTTLAVQHLSTLHHTTSLHFITPISHTTASHHCIKLHDTSASQPLQYASSHPCITPIHCTSDGQGQRQTDRQVTSWPGSDRQTSDLMARVRQTSNLMARVRQT